MKYIYLTSFLVIFCCIANAQLSILPQWGVERSQTNLRYNNSADFSPLGAKFSPHASLRVDYKFKNSHGPFVGIATTRSAVDYSYSNPETGKTDYTASRDNKQLRFEGGYQLNTKRIYFNNTGAKNTSANASTEMNNSKRSCLDFYLRSHCGSKNDKSSASSSNADKRTWMSIQPSAGMAFVPGARNAEIATKNQGAINTYEYNAGNWKTAFIAGAGFIFGKDDQEKFIVSINYLKGIGNLQTKSLTTTPDVKPITTSLSSSTYSWNLRVGVPISFTKKTVAKKEVIIKQPAIENKESSKEKKCGGYIYRCRKAA